MLVLNRRKGQSIDIEGCSIAILQINGGIVKLGITAPRGVRVMRSELLDKQETSDVDTAEVDMG